MTIEPESVLDVVAEAHPGVEWLGMEKPEFTSEDYNCVVYLRIDGSLLPEVEEIIVKPQSFGWIDGGDDVNLFLHLVGFPTLKTLVIGKGIVVISLITEDLPNLWLLKMDYSETSWDRIDLPALSFISCRDWEVPPPSDKYPRLRTIYTTAFSEYQMAEAFPGSIPGKGKDRNRYILKKAPFKKALPNGDDWQTVKVRKDHKTRYPPHTYRSRTGGPCLQRAPLPSVQDQGFPDTVDDVSDTPSDTTTTETPVVEEMVEVKEEMVEVKEEVVEQADWPVLGQVRPVLPVWPRRTTTPKPAPRTAAPEVETAKSPTATVQTNSKKPRVIYSNTSQRR